MKLNMGCGYNRREGFINVDAFDTCSPDIVCNLETLPWPWEDSSASTVVFNHSLEHMGQDPQVFLGIMKELYRICKHDATIYINVPHPRHDFFLGDPTHVRPITPMVLALFDKALNDQWKAKGISNTPLAHYLGVNFKVVSTESVPDTPYKQAIESGELSKDDFNQRSLQLNNLISEYRFIMKAIKQD